MRLRLAAACLAFALLAGCTPAPVKPVEPLATATSGYGGAELDTPYALPDLALSDQAGKSFNLRTGSDRPVLVRFFGYTNCPDICLGVLTDLASALNRVPDDVRGRIQVVFVTVDPDRDSPAVLARYLSRIDPGFVGLTGPAKTIEQVAGSMGVGSQGVEQRPDGGYEVNHTVQVVGFDSSRRGVLVWTQGTPIGTFEPTSSAWFDNRVDPGIRIGA